MTTLNDTAKHPLERFAYCPACGSSHFVVNNMKSKRCTQCGFVYYANPSAATAAFIVRDGALLVARRAQEPAKGTLDLPGGFVDMDETAEQGMAREIMEETGLSVTALRLIFTMPNLYPYSGMIIHTLDMFYQAEVEPHAEPVAADDAAELLWVPLGQVRPELFGLLSVRQAVGRFLRENVKKTKNLVFK